MRNRNNAEILMTLIWFTSSCDKERFINPCKLAKVGASAMAGRIKGVLKSYVTPMVK